MPPDERRQTIIAAARPLLIANGAQFTTKQVAEAAGIAEGTIFRVFATKQDLLVAVIEDALDPAAPCAAIRALPAQTDLVTHLTSLFELLRGRIDHTSAVLAAVHAMPSSEAADSQHPRVGHGSATHQDRITKLRDAIADSLAPWADGLRLPVEQVASLVRSLAFSANHPYLSDHQFTDPRELAEVVVHGIIKD